MLRRKLTAGVAAAFAAATMLVGAAAPAAVADDAEHYYIQVGGTGSAVPPPECTSTYRASNPKLNDQGAVTIGICYPASFWPFIGPDNTMPAPTALTYDESVRIGFDETLRVATDVHRNDSSARITLVGYSQGADVADRVLQRISNNETEIPRELVSGKLYADPRQPGTGLWNLVPAGVYVPGVGVSPGAGPVDFPGMEVERHCIETDGVCDTRTLEGIGGYFIEHPKYPAPGGIIERTIDTGGNGVVWHKR